MKDWPLPSFSFLLNGESLGEWTFSEVSGLGMEETPTEYRVGEWNAFSLKTPGSSLHPNIVFRRGVAANSGAFKQLMADIELGDIKRETVTLSLLDTEGNPRMTWTIEHAFPTKITSVDAAFDDHAAIDELELAYEFVMLSYK